MIVGKFCVCVFMHVGFLFVHILVYVFMVLNTFYLFIYFFFNVVFIHKYIYFFPNDIYALNGLMAPALGCVPKIL